jgi:hypothetical protein
VQDPAEFKVVALLYFEIHQPTANPQLSLHKYFPKDPRLSIGSSEGQEGDSKCGEMLSRVNLKEGAQQPCGELLAEATRIFAICAPMRGSHGGIRIVEYGRGSANNICGSYKDRVSPCVCERR